MRQYQASHTSETFGFGLRRLRLALCRCAYVEERTRRHEAIPSVSHFGDVWFGLRRLRLALCVEERTRRRRQYQASLHFGDVWFGLRRLRLALCVGRRCAYVEERTRRHEAIPSVSHFGDVWFGLRRLRLALCVCRRERVGMRQYQASHTSGDVWFWPAPSASSAVRSLRGLCLALCAVEERTRRHEGNTKRLTLRRRLVGLHRLRLALCVGRGENASA
ncbi:hypothetical protein EVAR_18923_1 [Eumeta japonica]|uniref:Uncharacterized protein n=1 Tax=Eumeta variegata TaxID=151549 RepID=A0A4C1V2L0_EUMVA|nr:hypothetical protein EVAR_18923_1 [Eumeta japonica]